MTFLIARIFAGGLAPPCTEEADANGDNGVNISDVTYLIARIFADGPAPVCGLAQNFGWSQISIGLAPVLWDVWGTSMSDVFAVGFDGAIVHFDGFNWSVMLSGTADSNGDNAYNIADITYGISRIFAGGPAPVCGKTGA